MENTQDIDVTVHEPHFDDEMTVITAQPVVPLEVIAEARTHKRRWFLAGAFALALLLGAVTALVAITIKRQMAESSVVQSAVIEDQPATVSDISQIQGGETTALATKSEEEPDEEDLIPAPAPTYKERDRPKKEPQRAVTKSHSVKKPVKDEEPEPVLVDQWEERRSRRVWRRERKERRQRQELFRIGEIFEGRRRSDRPN